MYYWRRRLPNALASWFHKRHLFLSLQTPEPNFARRLVVLLDAKLEEVVTAFEHAEMHLTPSQVDGLLRDVVTNHLDKLERLSAAAKSFANFDASQAERDDRRAAWADCGLMTSDVIEDNGPYQYLHISKNKFRRIKNGQSKRNIVIHPHLIRLGFLRYVALIRSLGYELVFPDLFSPTTKSLLGNRYYKLFKPVLITAGITEEGLGSHALRHAFGAILKKRSEEHTSELQSHLNLVCRLLLEKKKKATVSVL